MKFFENADIEALIIGCRNHDDEAFDELVRRYTPMMRKVICSFPSVSDEFGELFSEACVALHIAAQRYDLGQSDVTFGLYARICVRNRILGLLRNSDSSLDYSECDVEQMGEDRGPEADIIERESFDRIMNSARNLLSDYEYRVLMLHIQGYKTAVIAESLGRTAKSVDNAKSRIFRRLRAEHGSEADN